MRTEIVWRPSAALLEESNVARFAAAEGIADFATLRDRSIADPEWFWDAVVRFLGLVFSRAVHAGRRSLRRCAVGPLVHRRAAEPRVVVRRPLGRRPGHRRSNRRGLGRRGRHDPHALVARAARAHRRDRLRARGPRCRRGRRGRAVPADGSRDGRRAARGGEARRAVPPDLLRLRRRRRRDPARRRAGRRARHRRRLHPARQGRADEGDGRRRRRVGAVGAHGRRGAPPRSRRADARRSRSSPSPS